jgi:hypothetical protein
MPRRSKVQSAPPAAKDSRADRRVQLTDRQLEVALLVEDEWSSGRHWRSDEGNYENGGISSLRDQQGH